MRKLSKYLLFTSCLLILTLGGCRSQPAPQVPEPVTLGPGEPVAISPDGTTLLVVRERPEHNEGWLQPTTGGEGKKVLEFTSTTFYSAFSPDGRYLAWASDGLWLAGADGTGAMQVLDEGGGGAFAWSPDSSRLAVAVGDAIKLFDVTGREVGHVAQVEGVRALNWSSLSSGERIIFVSYPADQPAYVSSVKPDGQELTQLAIAEEFALAGDRIYVAEPFSAGPLRLLDIAAGSEVQVVVESGVQTIAPRPPDYAQVSYLLQGEEEFSADLWLVQANGQNPRQLTAGVPVLGQLWSPDGKKLYFAAVDFEAGEEEEAFQVQAIDVP